MIQTAQKIKIVVLESELEALLTEAELIRVHQPHFNIQLKDDKSPIYVVITNQDFPQVLRARKPEIDRLYSDTQILGPFISSYKLNEVLKIARRIFPWCSQGESHSMASKRACFYYHLQLCPGVCIGETSAQEYQLNIQQLIKFLKGRKKEVIADLKNELKQAVKKEEFEKAGLIKKKIEMILEVTSYNYTMRPDLLLPSIHSNQNQEALNRLRAMLRSQVSLPPNYPLERIEGYDVSNVQGKNAAVSMVVFENGEATNKEYRLFNIRSIDTPNDYHMMQEALTRRQNHPEWQPPNLVVIDGGKGQLRSAINVWKWNNPIISVVKNPDRIIIPKIIKTTGKKDRVRYKIVKLHPDDPTLKLLERVRDESHRFAKKQHSKLHTKQLFS